MKKITLAFVDDHQIVIDGLQSLLCDEPRFHFAFATTNPGEVLELLAHTPVDVLLTDIQMPGLSGDALARAVHARFPATKILALSMSGDGELVRALIEEASIAGYMLKNIGRNELVTAIEKIAAGGQYFSPEVMKELERSGDRRRESEEAHLTLREIEIIRLIEKEYSNRQIADTLCISERTVETHRKNIFRKTGTSGVLGLVKYAYEHRLIVP
ncbi:MAG: response regulator transcription factor [Chitinophagaceae bacterium]|nr:MAG: response regulator transcription factor [Chitinophagaceae bacterium]